MIINCVNCNKEFKKKRKDHKYCCTKCKMQYSFRPEWRPISTAPKNQEILIGAMVNEVDGWKRIVKWDKKENCWKSMETFEYLSQNRWNPTHWLPIPELKEKK